MFKFWKRAREHLRGETCALLDLREEKVRTRRERVRAQERGMEATSGFTANVIRAWREAGVDVDIERELVKLEGFGNDRKAGR